jgi:cell wall assembly regulator SMI1
MDEWVDSMKRTLLAVERLGAEIEPLVIGPPATERDLARVESALGMSIPESFRKVLTKFSANVDLRWQFPDSTELCEDLREIAWGMLSWSLEAIATTYEAYQGWIDNVFPDIADPYDCVWHNRFPVLEVGNGDFVAIALSGDDAGAVIYLDHEGSIFNGCRLAENFEDFVDRYIALGCAGPDGWTLEVFVGDPDLGLQTDCPHAKLWRAYLYGSDAPEQTDIDAFQMHRVAARKKTDLERAIEILEASTDPHIILGIYAAHPDLALDAGIDEIYRLLAADSSESRQYACMALGAFRDPSVLDWIEQNVPALVTTDWGALAAVSSFTWSRATAWLRSGRPLSLVALDALKESAKTGTFEWPPSHEVELALSAYLATDSAPRVKQAINFVLSSLRNSGLR